MRELRYKGKTRGREGEKEVMLQKEMERGERLVRRRKKR